MTVRRVRLGPERDPSFRFTERGELHFKGVLGEHTAYAVHGDSAVAVSCANGYVLR